MNRSATRYRDVTTRELDRVTGGRRIVDVRERDEYVGELGHLPGAELVPLGALPSVVSDWARETPLLLVCRSGGRSSRAAELLVQHGFRDVLNLSGGMLAVNAAKLPVERS
jgi:rhodanese-related sulfurtransferase